MAWLTNWNYRKAITISNSGSTLTDYQTLVTIDTATLVTAGKLLSNCDDIRFTNSDGSTPINHWIESGINTSSTKIWLKIPSISTGSNTVYLYYGNISAVSASDGTNTFLFFDNGEMGAPSADWISDGGTISLDSGTVYSGTNSLKMTSSGSSGVTGVYKSLSNYSSLILETMARVPITTKSLYWSVYDGGLTTEKGVYFLLRDNGNIEYYDGSFHAIQAYSANTWYKIKLVIKSTSVYDIYINDVLKVSNVGMGHGTPSSFNRAYLYSYQIGGVSYTDNYIIRKYASPEPTLSSIGTEEQGVTATNMTLSTNTCAGSCQITATVTWQNLTSSSVTFTPAILIDGTTYVYATEITIGPNPATDSSSILTPSLSVGTHQICPVPN